MKTKSKLNQIREQLRSAHATKRQCESIARWMLDEADAAVARRDYSYADELSDLATEAGLETSSRGIDTPFLDLSEYIDLLISWSRGNNAVSAEFVQEYRAGILDP